MEILRDDNIFSCFLKTKKMAVPNKHPKKSDFAPVSVKSNVSCLAGTSAQGLPSEKATSFASGLPPSETPVGKRVSF
jgi:hypothetical protein